MRVIPIASVEGAISMPTPVVTASTTSTGSPSNIVDGNHTTIWASSAGANFIQVDLGRIVKVYRLEVSWGNTVPANFDILTTDSPDDRGYGTYLGAFDRITPRETISPSPNAIQAFTFDSKPARYWRVYSPTQAEIKDIFFYAGSPAPATNARVRIGYTSSAGGNFITGGTIFSEESNDLLDIEVNQSVDRQVWGGMVELNNKAQKRSRGTFPEGTPVKIWLDGVSSLLGRVVNDDPKFDASSLTLGVEVRGEDEFLNQEMRQAYAATLVSDRSASNDIISRGPFSILAQVTNSVGARVIGNDNVRDAVIGPNNHIYTVFKPPMTKFQALADLAESTLDGWWVLQNPTFAASIATYGANIGRVSAASTTDGYWFGTMTHNTFITNLRAAAAGGGQTTPVALLDPLAASGSAGLHGTVPSTLALDDSIANETNLQYCEVFQNVFFPISSSGLAFKLDGVSTRTATGGDAGGSTRLDMIIETVDKVGQVKRLHLVDWDGISINEVDTDTDRYTGVFQAPVDGSYAFTLGGAVGSAHYTTKFGSNSIDDVVTTIRVRAIPVATAGAYANVLQSYAIDDFSVSTQAHVKTPPQRYDFYVHESSAGSYSPDLFWFPRPRPGTGTDGRHLADSNAIVWYTTASTLASAEANNVESFHLMKGDVYRVKNDISVVGTQPVVVPDSSIIDCSASDYLNRIASKSTHSSRQEIIQMADMQSMTSVGRRPHFLETQQTDTTHIAREAVKTLREGKLAENRGTIVVRGNANLQPGNVVQVKSDYSELAGYYYIIHANHKWNASGFKTTLTVDDDRFRLSNEFARVQVGILSATGRGIDGTVEKLVTSTMGKINANVSSTGTAWDAQQLSLPLNILPELSGARKVRVTLTRALDREGRGVTPPISSSGWDNLGSLARDDVDYEVRIDERRWVAQRFTFTTTAGGLIARFRVRRPVATSVSTGELWAAVTAEQSGAIRQKVVDFSAGIPDFIRLGVLLPEQRPENIKLISDGWVRIPYSEIGQAGTDTGKDGPDPPSGTSTSDIPIPGPDCWMEFKFTDQLKPATPYWVVLRAVSSGTGGIPAGNLYVKAYTNPGGTTNLSNYGVIREPSAFGGGDQMFSIQESLGIPEGGPLSNQFSFYLAPTQALSSAGRTGENNGNGGYVVEPVTGRHYPFKSVPGEHQRFGFVEFPTAVVSRKDGFGDVVTSFAVSFGAVGGSVISGNNQSMRRCDYTIGVDYLAT